MSSIYTPRPAYQDLDGSIVLLSIVKRFPTFLQCEALYFAAGSDLNLVRLANSPLEFRDAVAALPVNAILGPIWDGVPLTLYVSKPGFEEDFKEVAGDIAVSGCELIRAAPDAENPFFLVFGKTAELPATAVRLIQAQVEAPPAAPAVPPPKPAPPAVQPPREPAAKAMVSQPPVVVPSLKAAPSEAAFAAQVQPGADVASPGVPVEVEAMAEQALALPAAPDAGTAAEVPAAATPVAAPAGGSEAAAIPADDTSEPLWEMISAPPPLLVQAMGLESSLPVASDGQSPGSVAAQTNPPMVEPSHDGFDRLLQQVEAAGQQALQTHQEIKQLVAGQQAALLASVEAKLAQMQELAANRQLMVARQAQDEQADRQMTALRHLQQEQATQLQALLVRLQNEQSEWQQETFKTLERERLAGQQTQVERPAWYAAGAKELGRAVAEQGEALQAALKAQQDQIIALQKTIGEWRSQRSARSDEPALAPDLGPAVDDLAWKVEVGSRTVKGISTRLGLLFALNVLMILAVAVGFIWNASNYNAAVGKLRAVEAPSYGPPLTPTPQLAVLAEPTVALTGVALKCADADMGRVYYECTLSNGVAYPQTLSLSILADGDSTNGFFPSVTLGDKQIFPDPSTTLASLGRFEVGQLKRFRINVPCADAQGCKSTTFVVRVIDNQASVVPGSEILLTSVSPAP